MHIYIIQLSAFYVWIKYSTLNSPPVRLKVWISLRFYCVHTCKHCSTLTRNIRNWRKHHRFPCHNLDRYMCDHHLHHTWKRASMKYEHYIAYLQKKNLLGNYPNHLHGQQEITISAYFCDQFCEYFPIFNDTTWKKKKKEKKVDSVLWYTSDSKWGLTFFLLDIQTYWVCRQA